MTWVLMLSATAILFGSVNASAQYFRRCSEPTTPFCIDSYGTFDDEWSFRRCRSEVEAFVSVVQEFISCTRRNQQEAAEEADRIVERFNCKARGETFCR